MFPVETGGKKPLIRDWPNKATTDPRRIHAWWSRWPDANIGMPTGERPGRFVVDVDRPEALGELGRELPATRTVRTPRGGIHLYFSHVEGVTNSPGGLPKGIDVRGQGGYVLLPPSVTAEGAYWFENQAEVAEAPGWLVELVRERPRDREEGRSRRTAEVPDGEPIPEGTRNTTLFFMALGLKDSGKSREEVLDELLATNEGRCSTPLDAGEVEQIAKSAMRYPVRSGNPSPEVLEAVERLEEFWWAKPWSGMGGKTDRDVYRVVVELARRYGRLNEDGSVAVSASVRSVALAAATRYATVSISSKRLFQAGLIRKTGSGRNIDEHAATWELLPPARLPRNTQHPGEREAMPCVTDLSRRRLWDLTTPAFRWTGHVKKGRAGVLYVLEAHGPMHLEALAELMGWSRPRDLRARYVDPLVDLGLVEERDGLLALPGDHAERVEQIRKAPYRTVRRRGRRSVDPATGREVRWVEETEYTASEVEREEKDRRDHRDHRKGFRLHLARQGPEADERCRELLNAWDEERESGTIEYEGMVVDRETGEVLEDRIIRSEAEVFELARAWFGREAA